jgi:glycosyltransferase involved in cell wall biosynthesis
MAKRLAVVIPSRSQPAQAGYLAKAIASIRAQSSRDLAVEIIVCLDNGAGLPALPNAGGVRFVEAPSRGQAAALNAGTARVSADYVAFLEDDDQWHPERTTVALRALANGDFTSTTQLEMEESGSITRINDFPTPSGWFMPISSWHRVGPFNEAYRWHLDNEWLGRLAESGLRRVHTVEATAPVNPSLMAQVRPWLLNCLKLGGPHVAIARHSILVPLVNRLVHTNSGMAMIERDPQALELSRREYEQLVARFGRVPW